MEEFGDTVVKFPISGSKPSMDDWRKKIRPFTAESVEHEYISILKKNFRVGHALLDSF